MRCTFLLSLFTFLLAAHAAGAATLRVPEDYATINAAIDVAAAGDSILVGPGTWKSETRSLWVCGNFLTRRSVMFLKPGLTIIGTAGAAATILDGGVVLRHPQRGSTSRGPEGGVRRDPGREGSCGRERGEGVTARSDRRRNNGPRRCEPAGFFCGGERVGWRGSAARSRVGGAVGCSPNLSVSERAAAETLFLSLYLVRG